MIFYSASSTKNETFEQIKNLTERGDIMEATMLSTQLVDQEAGLPPPISPLYTPTHKTNLEDTMKDDAPLPLHNRFDLTKVYF